MTKKQPEYPDHIGVSTIATRAHEQMIVEGFMDGQPSIMADEPQGFDIGEPPVLHGQSRGWTPVHLQLAALAMCTSITARVVAENQNFAHRDIQTSMTSLIDIRGFFFDLHLQPKYEQITFDLTVATRESPARIKALALETDRRCPQLGLFRAAEVPLLVRWHRRGEKNVVYSKRFNMRGKSPEERLRLR